MVLVGWRHGCMVGVVVAFLILWCRTIALGCCLLWVACASCCVGESDFCVLGARPNVSFFVGHIKFLHVGTRVLAFCVGASWFLVC